MQHFFDEFHFTRKTRAGALALLLILVLLILLWLILPALTRRTVDKDEWALQAAWSELKKENTLADPHDAAASFNDPIIAEATPGLTQPEAVLFPFDPNTASEAEFLRLGLPRYTVNTILKFRKSNPRAFKAKEDLKKLYTLKKEDYERIAPYVNIAANPVSPDRNDHAIPQQADLKIELNHVTATQLIALRGIGPAFSKRIITFRDALGGFLYVEQLKEVYGLPDSTYQQLKERFTVNASLVRKIDLNTADENTLARQPYIGKKVATGIIKLRNDLGPFRDLEQLRQVPLINEEKYRKIAPYLTAH